MIIKPRGNNIKKIVFQDTEVLELVHVRDVRTGQYAKAPKAQVGLTY